MTSPYTAVNEVRTTTDELWAVNIQGPDDVFAAASRAEAVNLAAKFNAWWIANFAAKGLDPNDPTLWAAPTLWRYDAELHAGSLATFDSSEYAWLRQTATPRSTDIKSIKDCVEAIQYAAHNDIKAAGMKTIHELCSVAVYAVDRLASAESSS